jgi:hypothetical protein
MNDKTELATTGAAHFDRMIEKLAAQKVDFAQIEKMYELRERFQREEARKAFEMAMADFKAEPIVVEKRRRVDYKTKAGGHVKYDYAELADFTEVVGPIMSKYGLSFRWTSEQTGSLVTVTCIVTHAQGHSISVTNFGPLDDSGMKNQIQQLGSTLSFLQRYTLTQAAGVAARGIDDDGRGGPDVDDVDPQQEAIDDIYSKIGLSLTLGELQALKPDILAIKNADRRRELMGGYNGKLHEFTGQKSAETPE